MVNCAEFESLAAEVLEGGLSRRASEHLAACTRCQTLVEDLRAIAVAAGSLPEVEPRPELWESLQARALEEGLLPQPAVISCEDFPEFAGGILEGEPNPKAVEHLTACTRCQTLVEDLRGIAVAASSLPAIEPRPELWESLQARALEEGLLPQPAVMSCEDFREFAGEVLEGERHPEAFEHLYGCANCRTLLHELDAVARAAHALPTYEPGPDLWFRLRASVRKENLWQEESWWERWLFVPQPVLASGFAAIMLLVSLGLVYSPIRFPLPEYGELPDSRVASGERVSEADYNVRYEIHLIQFEQAVLDEDAPVTDELVDLVERPLSDVDRAIENTRAALEGSPGNLQMRNELNRLYRQKASVLQVMTDLTWHEYGE